MRATISAKNLKEIINNTKKFLSTNLYHELMQYIKLDFDSVKKEVRAVALDGHRVSVEFSDLAECEESFSCLIKPNIPKIGKNDICAEIELVNGKAFITIGESITGFIQPEGQYYNVDTILKDFEKNKLTQIIGLNANFVKDAMDSIKIDNGRPLAKFEIYGERDPIIIRSGKKNMKIILPVNFRD